MCSVAISNKVIFSNFSRNLLTLAAISVTVLLIKELNSDWHLDIISWAIITTPYFGWGCSDVSIESNRDKFPTEVLTVAQLFGYWGHFTTHLSNTRT